MTVSYSQFRRDNRAGVDKLLDWLRINLMVLLCGGLILGIALEETCLAVKTIVSAKHQKQKEKAPNGFAEAVSSRSDVVPSTVTAQGTQTANGDTSSLPALADTNVSPIYQNTSAVFSSVDHYQTAVYYPNGIRLKTVVNR